MIACKPAVIEVHLPGIEEDVDFLLIRKGRSDEIEQEFFRARKHVGAERVFRQRLNDRKNVLVGKFS